MKRNVALIGFMGTGKTSIGRLLASRLGWSFVDVDHKIRQEAGMPVAEIFAQYGEEGFRLRERETIARVSRYRRAVIATGGGVVLNPDNVARLRQSGVVVCLTASKEVILERTGRRNTRPLLAGPDRAEVVDRLLAERAGLYAAAADYTIDTSELSPRQTVEKIVAFLRREGHFHGRGKSESAQQRV